MIDEVERQLHDDTPSPELAAEMRAYEAEQQDGDTPGEVAPRAGSDLDRIKAAVKVEVRKTADFAVPARPGFTMRFRTDIKATELEKYRKLSTRNGVANLGFNAALLIANTNTAILQGGRVLTGSDGSALTVAKSELMQTLGMGTAAAAATVFVGSDGDLISLGNAISVAAGFGGEQIERVDEDPTATGSPLA